ERARIAQAAPPAHGEPAAPEADSEVPGAPAPSAADGPPADPGARGAPALPPGAGPPAGVEDAVAHLARSDWRGCSRAGRAAPRPPEIRGARMSCARRASGAAELRATCAEMRAHYPAHPQTQRCDS